MFLYTLAHTVLLPLNEQFPVGSLKYDKQLISQDSIWGSEIPDFKLLNRQEEVAREAFLFAPSMQAS